MERLEEKYENDVAAFNRELKDWEKKFPGRIENMFSALQNIVPSHLMDSKQYDFKGLKVTGVPSDDGDKAFDEEEFAAPSLPGLQVVSL